MPVNRYPILRFRTYFPEKQQNIEVLVKTDCKKIFWCIFFLLLFKNPWKDKNSGERSECLSVFPLVNNRNFLKVFQLLKKISVGSRYLSKSNHSYIRGYLNFKFFFEVIIIKKLNKTYEHIISKLTELVCLGVNE